ncbi:MAG: OsmC family protein [Salinigranum sp.]
MAPQDDAEKTNHLGDRTVVRKSSVDEFASVAVRDKHELLIDEPEWLPMGVGTDRHPAPVDHLVVGLVACQVEVLDQALQKARVEEYDISATAEIDELGMGDVPEGMPANTGQLIEHIDVDLTVETTAAFEGRVRRCLDVYDGGCIVGRSYRAGIDYTPHANVEVRE